MDAVIASSPDIAARIARLRDLRAPARDLVTVCLDTHWSDEHQRDRTRVFLARELRRARAARVAAPADLDWIAAEGQALVDQSAFPDARGVALFACQALGLREVVPAPVPFEETFVVDDRPDLRSLASLVERRGAALVVFVDGETARLFPLDRTDAGDEMRLEGAVPRQHRRGGWALLEQSGYARHVEMHRHEHFGAVAAAVTGLVDGRDVRHVVLAGQDDRVAAFREHLPARVQRLVAAQVHAMAREPASAIARRAAARLDAVERGHEAADVDDVLTEAAKGGRAIAGAATLGAAQRGAIHRLYLLASLRRAAHECEACGALQETGRHCALCGASTREVDLATALTGRVVAAGGRVERVTGHAGLAARGGMAARLRYALG